jgi:hypothetical protein
MPNILIWDTTTVQILLDEGIPNSGSGAHYPRTQRSHPLGCAAAEVW